jgi:hypothetical protein
LISILFLIYNMLTKKKSAKMTASAATAMSWAKIVKSHLDQNPQSEIVIEIDHEPTISTAAAEQQPLQPAQYTHSNEVDPVAKEIAIQFYEQNQGTLHGSVRRNNVEHLFYQKFPDCEKDFSVVLFALAKGLKCVNVFNRGQDLQWFPLSKTQLNRIKRSMKQKVPSSDGWTGIGAKAVIHEQHPLQHDANSQQQPLPPQIEEEQKQDQPKPDFGTEIAAHDVPSFPNTPEQEPISPEDLMHQISQIRAEIKEYDGEIESLIPFHREHLREMNRVKTISDTQLGIDLFNFHDLMKSKFEVVLNDLQAEISAKRERLAKLCDLLKH